MPEGPEIRRAADELEVALKGARIEKIELGLPALRKYKKQLMGQTVLSVETHGKALLTHFDNDKSIYSHNQLYGLWFVRARDDYPQTNRQLRLALHTATHSALLYSASDISVWQTADLGKHPFLAKLGPDILNKRLTWREVAERLQSKQFCNRTLAAIYLDQAFLAGLGNYLRSEILFVAGVHPTLKPSLLSRAQIGNLARATIEISQRSYLHEGVTVSNKLYASLRKHGLNYERARFFVFGREGQKCRTCSTKVERTTMNTRRVYICAKCQPVKT